MRWSPLQGDITFRVITLIRPAIPSMRLQVWRLPIDLLRALRPDGLEPEVQVAALDDGRWWG
jgi:hypothetical protein